MSLEALTWALAQGDLRSSQKFVLVVLANYANEDWEAYPSAARLSELTCLNNETVWTALKELESRGLIVRQERRQVDGTKKSNIYRLAKHGFPTIEDSAIGGNPTMGQLPAIGGNPTSIQKGSDTKDIPTGEVEGAKRNGVINEIRTDPLDPEEAREEIHKLPGEIHGVDDIPHEWIVDYETIIGKNFRVTNEARREILALVEKFPGIDMEFQLSRAVQYLQMNPHRIKSTTKDRTKWLSTDWLSKAKPAFETKKLPPSAAISERQVDTDELYPRFGG